MGEREFHVVTLNVNGLTSPIKRAKMIAKAKKEKSQIVFWQETHLQSSEHEKLKKIDSEIRFTPLTKEVANVGGPKYDT